LSWLKNVDETGQSIDLSRTRKSDCNLTQIKRSRRKGRQNFNTSPIPEAAGSHQSAGGYFF
jgi:hypothetical protein